MAYSHLEILRRLLAIADYLELHKGDKTEYEVIQELIGKGYTRQEIATGYYLWLNQ